MLGIYYWGEVRYTGTRYGTSTRYQIRQGGGNRWCPACCAWRHYPRGYSHVRVAGIRNRCPACCSWRHHPRGCSQGETYNAFHIFERVLFCFPLHASCHISFKLLLSWCSQSFPFFYFASQAPPMRLSLTIQQLVEYLWFGISGLSIRMKVLDKNVLWCNPRQKLWP
jgi:hypothetical protein